MKLKQSTLFVIIIGFFLILQLIAHLNVNMNFFKKVTNLSFFQSLRLVIWQLLETNANQYPKGNSL